MTWNNRYVPPDATPWQGRSDVPAASCFFQTIRMLDLQQPMPPTRQPGFGLIGFCCEEGIRRNLGRLGAAEGPVAIRKMLARLPIHRHDLPIYDAGNITCTDNNLEEAQQALGMVIAMLLEHHITPIILGGGHETAWGHFQGIQKQYPMEKLAIINFDAHFDMRPLHDNKGTSGTPFLQIVETCKTNKRAFGYYCIGIQENSNIDTLFNTAKQYNVKMISADDIHQNNEQACANIIRNAIDDHQIIYLSLCLDVFAAAYAPGVSAPQALGLMPWQVIPWIRKIASSGKTLSYDIAELSPNHDDDSQTARLAANLVYEIIHHHQ